MTESASKLRRFLTSSFFGTVLIANLAIFMPLTLYLGNHSEFAVDFVTMLLHFARLLIAFAALTGLLGLLLPIRAYPIWVATLATLGLLLWIQGNFVLWDYGPLDGRQIDWSQGVWRGWADLALWLIALGATWFALRTRRTLLLNLATAVFAVQVLNAALSGVNNADILLADSDSSTSGDALAQSYTMSRNKNVVHMILDGFQADIFEELVANENNRQSITEVLDGFVFYRNNVSAFPFTHMSLPALLSGQLYNNQITINEFRQRTFGDQSILNAAFDAGYEVDIAAPAALLNMYRIGRYTNAYVVPKNLHLGAKQRELDETTQLLDLSLFRSMPHFLKPLIFNKQRWLTQRFVGNSESLKFDFFSYNLFQSRWSESMSATREAPVYKMFHLMLSHRPMVTAPNCEPADEVLQTTRENVLNQAGCALRETARVLQRMKELGVYDDALIVLMGDHGSWVTPKGVYQKVGADGQIRPMPMGPTHFSLALPLLAIKLPGASGPLITSNAPTWTADVPDTISAGLGLGASFGRRNIAALQEDEQRERMHYIYSYSRAEYSADWLTDIQEFVIDGDVYNGSAWRAGRTFPPANKVSQ